MAIEVGSGSRAERAPSSSTSGSGSTRIDRPSSSPSRPTNAPSSTATRSIDRPSSSSPSNARSLSETSSGSRPSQLSANRPAASRPANSSANRSLVESGGNSSTRLASNRPAAPASSERNSRISVRDFNDLFSPATEMAGSQRDLASALAGHINGMGSVVATIPTRTTVPHSPQGIERFSGVSDRDFNSMFSPARDMAAEQHDLASALTGHINGMGSVVATIPTAVQQAAFDPIYRGPFVPAGRGIGGMPDYDELARTFAFDDPTPYPDLMEGAELMTPAYPRPSRERPVDPRVVQTMLGEAAGEGDLGIAAIGQAIMNRSQENPDRIIDPSDIALARLQFSTNNSPANGGNNPAARFPVGSPEFNRAEELFRDVRDNAFDFTFGSTNFFNPSVVQPDWAEPNVPGTERLFDAVNIGNHTFLPRVAPGDRASMNFNPALSASIAAGGIGPDRPIPQMRPASLGGGLDAIGPMSLNDPEARPGISDLVRMAQSPMSDRLAASSAMPPQTALTNGLGAVDVGDGIIRNPDGTFVPASRQQQQPAALVADDYPVVPEATMGGGQGPIPQGIGRVAPVPMPRPDNRDMSVWDNTISAAGDALDNTLIGGAIKAIFPEFWEGAGKSFAGMDDGGGKADINSLTPQSIYSMGGGSDYGTPSGNGAPTTPGTETTPTAPGTPGADGKVRDANGLSSQLWYPRVVWPGSDYDPGVTNEWDYFPEFAEGGLIPDAHAQQLPATSGLDPRLVVLMNAEDALKGQHPNPEQALAEFVEIFGEGAMRQLQDKVDGELAAASGGGRMIRGPGGPKDDAVPAVINDVQAAKLSDGEFVMPAEAVMGAGDGDIQAGAERLTQLADRLGGTQSSGIRVDQVA